MKIVRTAVTAACLAALFGAAQAQTAPAADAESRYVQRISGRYQDFAGSMANLESLAAGVRHGSQVTLTNGADTVVFMPPTKPMGYGNVTHALDLATRQLALAGVTQPTPQQIEAAMMGGTVATPQGDVVLQGVLQLRSQRMGWGQIAHAIGVHPSPRPRVAANVVAPHSSGITTAYGSVSGAPGARIRGRASGNAEGSTVRPAGGGTVITAGSASSAHARGNAFGRSGKP